MSLRKTSDMSMKRVLIKDTGELVTADSALINDLNRLDTYVFYGCQIDKQKELITEENVKIIKNDNKQNLKKVYIADYKTTVIKKFPGKLSSYLVLLSKDFWIQIRHLLIKKEVLICLLFVFCKFFSIWSKRWFLK